MQAMLSILSVIIGLVFVLLLFSLLTSTVMEIVAAMLSLRGKHLLVTLQNMLGEKSEVFINHPFFRQLSYAAHRSKKGGLTNYKLPAWVSKSTFSTILYDILHEEEGENLQSKIDKMPDDDLKKLLTYFLRNSDGTVQGFQGRIEHWFDEVMERSSDWYKRALKWWLFGVGMILAVLFNADTIQIYQSLSANSANADAIVKAAETFSAGRQNVAAPDFSKGLDQAIPEFKALANTYKSVVQSPLGLGWNENENGQGGLPWWLVKLAGMILTGIAVTFGAPFWFEVMKKLLSIRSSNVSGGSSDNYRTITLSSPNASFESFKSKKVQEDELEDFGSKRKTKAPPKP
jgi:hypothetical protein